jgi:transposase
MPTVLRAHNFASLRFYESTIFGFRVVGPDRPADRSGEAKRRKERRPLWSKAGRLRFFLCALSPEVDLPRFGGRFFTFETKRRRTMPRTRPPYPQEFRERIVELVRTGRTPAELADEFEPTEPTICSWIKQAHRDEGKSAEGLTTDERKELRKLRKKLRQMKQERDILANRCPSGTAWFAREKGDVPPKSSGS